MEEPAHPRNGDSNQDCGPDRDDYECEQKSRRSRFDSLRSGFLLGRSSGPPHSAAENPDQPGKPAPASAALAGNWYVENAKHGEDRGSYRQHHQERFHGS